MSVANNCEPNVYRIKKINFNGPRDIVTQNEKGPCALLGLANVLLLRDSMSFPSSQTTTSSTDLVDRIAASIQKISVLSEIEHTERSHGQNDAPLLFLSCGPTVHHLRDLDPTELHLPGCPQEIEHTERSHGQNDADSLLSAAPAGEASLEIHARQLNSALTSLEHLPRGMEVDVKVTGVTDFGPTAGLVVFAILGIPLYHTCLRDPASSNVAAKIKEDDRVKSIPANQAQEFLGTVPNRVTTHGLSQLTRSMYEGDLGVLFRDRHFDTIYKRNGVIYQLVTHEEYLHRDDIVWETLNSNDGVGKFVNGDFESEKIITIVDDCETREKGNYTILAGMANNLGLVDMDHKKGLHFEDSIDKSSEFPGRQYCSNSNKVCPSGHQLKEVPIIVRLKEQRSGYGKWSCSGCKNDTLELEGTRFRCDHHKVKNQLTPSIVSFRGEGRGGVECDFDLCGECFYVKQIKTDINDNTEENVEYRKHVVENIKELLVEHPDGIFDQKFNSMYRDAFGDKIDFQKLGYPAHKSNKSKFFQTLTGSILRMEYSTLGLYIKPSKSLLSQIDQCRIESLSLLDAEEFPDKDLTNQSVDNSVYGVRKQVRYPPGLKEGTDIDVIVTEVVSPAKFWFQLRGEETSDALESLMVEMESFYRNKEENYRLDNGNPRDKCKPGVIMAAPFKQPHDFHRVHVNKICKNNVNKAEVFYLDYGTVGRIPISCLRILDEKFSKLPAQALEGKLWGLAIPSGSKTWPKESARRFLELVGPVNVAGFGCYSIVKRIQTDTRVLHLQLIDAVTTRSPQGLCINEQLVQEGLAGSVDICEEEEIKSIEEDRSKQDVNNNVFNDAGNMDEATTVNDSSVAESKSKFFVSRVDVDENLSVNLFSDEGKIWLSSGDISSLMPSWRRKDLLAKMIQMRRLSIHSLDIVEETDRFEQIVNLGLHPTDSMGAYPRNGLGLVATIELHQNRYE